MPVIDSIVEYILMPIIAAIVGEPNFNTIGFDLGDARIGIGFVITALVSFVSVAFVLFLLVKAYNQAVPPEQEDAGPSEVELLTEIRDALGQPVIPAQQADFVRGRGYRPRPRSRPGKNSLACLRCKFYTLRSKFTL